MSTSDPFPDQEVRELVEPDEIKRLVLAPGETVVLEYPGQLTNESALRIKRIWEEHWPDNRVLVLDDGLRLAGILAES